MSGIERDQWQLVLRRLANLRGDYPLGLEASLLPVLPLLGEAELLIGIDEDTDFWALSAVSAAAVGNVSTVEIIAQTGGTVPDRIVVDGVFAVSDVLAGNSIIFTLGGNIGGAATPATERGPRVTASNIPVPAVVLQTANFAPPQPGAEIFRSPLPIPATGTFLPFKVTLDHVGAITETLDVGCSLVNANLRVSAWGRVLKQVKRG